MSRRAYDHDKGDGDDLGAHRRMHDVIGAKKAPPSAAMPTPSITTAVM